MDDTSFRSSPAAQWTRRSSPRRAAATVVVFDTQSVSLDRPVQVRGSILFAPFRQIFESQGGTLLWMPEDQKVTAISATKQIEMTSARAMSR